MARSRPKDIIYDVTDKGGIKVGICNVTNKGGTKGWYLKFNE